MSARSPSPSADHTLHGPNDLAWLELMVTGAYPPGYESPEPPRAPEPRPVLRVAAEVAATAQREGTLTLRDPEGVALATVAVSGRPGTGRSRPAGSDLRVGRRSPGGREAVSHLSHLACCARPADVARANRSARPRPLGAGALLLGVPTGLPRPPPPESGPCSRSSPSPATTRPTPTGTGRCGWPRPRRPAGQTTGSWWFPTRRWPGRRWAAHPARIVSAYGATALLVRPDHWAAPCADDAGGGRPPAPRSASRSWSLDVDPSQLRSGHRPDALLSRASRCRTGSPSRTSPTSCHVGTDRVVNRASPCCSAASPARASPPWRERWSVGCSTASTGRSPCSTATWCVTT